MWVFFAILSGLFYTGSNLISRHILRHQNDSWAFSFYFSAIGAVVTLPFFLLHWQVSHLVWPWVLMIAIGLVVTAHNWLNFRALNFISATLSATITKFRLIWILGLSALFLHEAFTWQKLIGTLLTLIAGLIIIGKFKKPKSLKGVGLALSATLFYALAIIIIKSLMSDFNQFGVTFFVFLFPAILNLLFMPQAPARIKSLIKIDGAWVILACVLGAGANLSMYQAFSAGEVSRVIVLIESALIFSLIGEHLWLKERTHIFAKIGAVLFALVGAILIQV